MKTLLVDKRYSPPEPDELEVSIFGPKFGESIIVHVPNWGWFVVDSLQTTDRGERLPAAIGYLDGLGVSSLWGLFLTHWHRDHTGGASKIAERYSSSLQVVGLPPAAGGKEFASFVADLLPEQTRYLLVKDLVDLVSVAKKRDLRRVSLVEGVTLSPLNASWSLTALSPTWDALQRYAAATPLSYHQSKPKSFDLNSTCAVLRLAWSGIVVLLASDLDAGTDSYTGWRAIAKTHGSELSSSLVKIGHHGSETAFYPPAWDLITSERLPLGTVTPFPARGNPLPRDNDIRRYKELTVALHMTGTHGSARTRPKHAGRAKLGQTPFRSYARLYSGSFSSIGQVRYRFRTNTAPTVEVFAPASEK